MSVVMYEFLAPWGVLVPVLSAAFCYFVSSEARRKERMKDFEVSVREGVSTSRTDIRPLSVMHG